MRTLEIATAEEMRALGASVAKHLAPGDVLGLKGNLGAGKTTFMQGFLRAIDPGLEALSPTYTLLNEYECEPPVYHFDLYRLEDLDGLESVGYWDIVEGGDGIVCVEWFDKIPGAFTGDKFIHIEHQSSGRLVRLSDSIQTSD